MTQLVLLIVAITLTALALTLAARAVLANHSGQPANDHDQTLLAPTFVRRMRLAAGLLGIAFMALAIAQLTPG